MLLVLVLVLLLCTLRTRFCCHYIDAFVFSRRSALRSFLALTSIVLPVLRLAALSPVVRSSVALLPVASFTSVVSVAAVAPSLSVVSLLSCLSLRFTLLRFFSCSFALCSSFFFLALYVLCSLDDLESALSSRSFRLLRFRLFCLCCVLCRLLRLCRLYLRLLFFLNRFLSLLFFFLYESFLYFCFRYRFPFRRLHPAFYLFGNDRLSYRRFCSNCLCGGLCSGLCRFLDFRKLDLGGFYSYLGFTILLLAVGFFRSHSYHLRLGVSPAFHDGVSYCCRIDI